MKKNTPTSKPVRYRCVGGRQPHEWVTDTPVEQNSLRVPAGVAGEVVELCPHCLHDAFKVWLAQMRVGKVEVIRDE